jgi:hypothetical protein
MDEHAHNDGAKAPALKSSRSGIGGRVRRFAIAEEEELFGAGRSAGGARWQHALVKSIGARRGKAFQF